MNKSSDMSLFPSSYPNNTVSVPRSHSTSSYAAPRTLMPPRIFRAGTFWKCYAFRGVERCDLGMFDTKFEALQACASFEEQSQNDVSGPKQNVTNLEVHAGTSAHDDDTGIDRSAKGVYPSGSKWVAQCFKDLEWHYLGRYDTKELATTAIINFEENLNDSTSDLSLPRSQIVQIQSLNDKHGMAELPEPHKSLQRNKVSAPVNRPPGVYVHHDKFAAHAYNNGKRRYLGVFNTVEEASAAVKALKQDAPLVGATMIKPSFSVDDNSKEEDGDASAAEDDSFETTPVPVIGKGITGTGVVTNGKSSPALAGPSSPLISSSTRKRNIVVDVPTSNGMVKEQWMARVHRAGLWRQIGIFDNKS